MKMLSLFLIIMSVVTGCSPSTNEHLGEVTDSTLVNDDGLELGKIQLPAGFKIDVFARVPNARSLALSPDGTLFVGNRGEDKVYAIQDINGDWKADKKYIISSGLKMPNGVAFKDGALYVGERSKLWKFSGIESKLGNPPTPELIYDDLPKDNHHGWKYIAFGPDGKIYVPVGAPCNICESQPTIPGSPNVHYASIIRMNADGSQREVYVDGVRNTVGFTWHPTTGEMWFTDNGRDNIGEGNTEITDSNPPCELNRVATKGQHFGYPYCHGGTILDPLDEISSGKNCEDYVAPAQNLGPHVAPLGLKFGITGNFPETYTNKIFIAEHGSWNKSKKSGYRVSLVTESNGVGQSYDTFASGWLDEATQASWGRPVDLVFAADGSMLLSDDLSGTIYRIWYEE